MDNKERKNVVAAFDALYAAVRKVSAGTAQSYDAGSLAELRDAFINSLNKLSPGTEMASVLDMDSLYDLMVLLSDSMDAISTEEDEGWNRFMDTIRDLVSK